MMNAQKKAVIGLILVSAFGFAVNQGYQQKAAQLKPINDAELLRRQDVIKALGESGADQAGCQSALQDFEKLYVADRESFLLFWDSPTQFDHYGAAFKKSLEACHPALKPFIPEI